MKKVVKAFEGPLEDKTLENYKVVHPKLRSGRYVDKLRQRGYRSVVESGTRYPEYSTSEDTDILYVDIDDIIIVSGDEWDFESTNWAECPWNEWDSDTWTSEEYPGLALMSSTNVIEEAYDLLESHVPEQPGRYKINCTLEIQFDLSDIGVNVTDRWTSSKGSIEQDIEYDVDNVYVTKTSAEVKNLRINQL